MVRYSQLYIIPLTLVTPFVHADKNYADDDFNSAPHGMIQSNKTEGDVIINTINVAPSISNINSYGLNAQDATYFTVNNQKLFTIKADTGIRVVAGSNMLLKGPGDIEINTNDRGIFVGEGGNLTSNSKINIESEKIGIMAYQSGSLTFNEEVVINVTEVVNHPANAARQENGIATQKLNPNLPDPEIVFNKKVLIKMSGNVNAAVATMGYGATGGTIKFNEGLDATIRQGAVLKASEGTHIILKGNSRLIIEKHNPGEIAEGFLAAYARSNSEIDISGTSVIEGDIAGIEGGKVNLDLEHSKISGGMTTNNDDPAKEGKVKVKLTNNSDWNMTKSSDITKLTLNNSTVNFIDTAGFSQLTTKTLSGNGLFTLRADFGAQRADQIIVTDTSSGEHQIDIVNKGNTSVNGTEKLTLVQTSDGTADFSLAHVVEAGGFEYGLRRVANNSKNWELYGLAQKTSTAEAGINFFNTSYLFNYIGTQTLFQRMGDLKATNGQEGDFWIRGFAGKLNSFNSNKVHGFTMNYNGYQLGIDKLLPMANGNLYVGAMLGYNHANPDYRKGSGTAKDYSTGLYSTYIDDNGFYVDAVAKYMYLKNHFQVTDTAGTKVTGTAKNHGYSLSLETGKRFAINNRPFYIEPQAQLTYSRMGSATIHASNGLEVMLNAYNSALARAGLAVGYQVNNAQNPIDIYLKPSYIKEFSGNTSYKLNNHKEKYDFSGGWVDTSLGINGQINNRHNIYGEISYANGDRFDKQQLNLGYRYQF